MPDAPSQGLLNDFAAPTNSVQQGYQEVNSQIMAAQNLHDNNMLKVFEFAGNGDVDAAKAFAASKGIQVPPEVLANADMAQGLALAGKMYPNDPNAAFKFSHAWIQNQGMDTNQRVLAASSIAGPPIDPEVRKYQAMAAMFQDRLKNGSLPHGKSADQSLFETAQKEAAAADQGAQKNQFLAGQPGYLPSGPAGDAAFANVYKRAGKTPPNAAQIQQMQAGQNQASDGSDAPATTINLNEPGEPNIVLPIGGGDNSGGDFSPAPVTRAAPSAQPMAVSATPPTAAGASGSWGPTTTGTPAAPAQAASPANPPPLPSSAPPPGYSLGGTIGGTPYYQDANGNRIQPPDGNP